MSTKPHRTWNRPVIGLVIAAMTFISGCGVGAIDPYLSPTFDPDSTPKGPPPEPVKYNFATFKSCLEIQQKAPNLPPPVPSPTERDIYPNQLMQSCIFKTLDVEGDPSIILHVELYENRTTIYGYQSGANWAKTTFNADLPGKEKDSTIHLGSEAQWEDDEIGLANDSCKLEILDENGVLIMFYNSGKGEDPRSEQCRAGAREIAKQIYAAVQPQ